MAKPPPAAPRGPSLGREKPTTRRLLGICGGLLAGGLGLSTVALHLSSEVAASEQVTDFVTTNAVTAVAFGIVGGVVLHVRPRHVIGRIMLVIGLAQGVTGLVRELGVLAYRDGAVTSAGWLLWVGNWAWLLTLWFPLLLLLLPDGLPPSPRWRPLVLLATVAPLPLLLSAALHPGALVASLPGAGPAPQNPLGGVRVPALEVLTGLLLLISTIAALSSLVLRWRRGGEQREQLTWVALAGAVVVVGLLTEIPFPDVAPQLAPVAVAVFAAAVGVAVVRHRMLDVDVVVSRTLLYVTLTSVLVGLYVAVVTLLGAAVRGDGRLLPGLVAAGLVAVAFAPLRLALQRGISRLFYGLRDDPYTLLRRVLDTVGASPAAEDVLRQLGDTVARALRLPYAAVVLAGEDIGDAPEAVVGLPLQFRGEEVGTLLLATRSGDERFSPSDELLLSTLARHAAAAAHAVQLTSQLRRSHDRLLVAREDERRRLRRDLHDGLGPQLAAVTVQLDAARRLLVSDPVRAGSVVADARLEVQRAVAEIRRLLDDLRPAVVEELGLVGAIQSLAASLREDVGVDVVVHANGGPLEQPVEMAAYRIVTEALANAVRHASASRVVVDLAIDDVDLVVEVRDDGVGLPRCPRTTGVGLSSMRDRAAELGGSLDLVSSDRGTAVRARLPRVSRMVTT